MTLAAPTSDLPSRFDRKAPAVEVVDLRKTFNRSRSGVPLTRLRSRRCRILVESNFFDMA